MAKIWRAAAVLYRRTAGEFGIVACYLQSVYLYSRDYKWHILNSCFRHPSFTWQSCRQASARMSTGVGFPDKPRVSFQIASSIQVTVFHMTTEAAREDAVSQRQRLVQPIAYPAQFAGGIPTVGYHKSGP